MAALALCAVPASAQAGSFGNSVVFDGDAMLIGEPNNSFRPTFRYDQNNLTWIWMIYLVSVVFLLLWFVYRWKTAGRIGMGIFLIAFLIYNDGIINVNNIL